METSALRFQNIFVGEPKCGCKMIFGAILNGKVVGSFYLVLFCHVLDIYIAFFICNAGKRNIDAMEMEFLFYIL